MGVNMTRGAVLSGAVTFAAVVSLPLLLADAAWKWNEVVALCLAAAIGASFMGGFKFAFGA
jgi:hypothetical protein